MAMRRVLFGAAVLAAMAGLAAGASAQMPPGPPGGMPGMGGPPGPSDGPGMGGPGMGPGSFGPGPFGPGMRPRMPPPTKSAVFSFSRGDTRVMIKCADDEPTRACVDAAGALIDKLAAASPH